MENNVIVKEGNSKEKVYVYVVPEVKTYLVEQSSKYGMSISGYINMIIGQYREQKQAMDFMGNLEGMLMEMKEIQLKEKYK